MIFPDIVEISTKNGPIYIHALGSRQKIFDFLTTAYFPENNRDDPEDDSEVEFN